MAARTFATPFFNTGDTVFRAWINEIHNALIAFGWVQTSDTGQINFSTVTSPAAGSTFQGYAVYRMNDSLQSTCPVYMRIDFGSASTAAHVSWKVQVTIGGTNGAGTLTGNVSTAQTYAATTAAGTNDTMRTSGSSSRFSLTWGGTTDTYGAFGVERDQSTAGADTDLGVNFLSTQSRTAPRSQFLETAGGTGAVESFWYCLLSAQTSQSGGGNVGVAPIRCQLGPFRNPMKIFALAAAGDFVNGTTNPVVIYGVTRTYVMVKNGTTAISWQGGVNTNQLICQLFE
jgi:hypothetical protein